MEYIISTANAPSGDIYEDETYCTRGLCSHPCCWESHIRQTRGFRRYVSLSADNCLERRQLPQQEDDSDDELATMKVLNMLDEYGDSPKDLYPSKYKGLPAHKQITRSRPRKGPSRPRNSAGGRLMPSVSPKTRLIKDIIEPSRKEAAVKQVEVQEVFDLEELSQNWDSTFLTTPMYVWIPGKRHRKKRKPTPRSGVERNPIEPDLVPLRNIDSNLLPRELSQEQRRPLLPAEPSSRQFRTPITPPSSPLRLPAKPLPRSRSPLPTGGQPYGNVGQTPKDRMRFRVIMNELKDLPRPFVIEVLEKARALDSKEDVLMLMERYLKTMRKSDWELSMVTGKVLQQQRLDSKMFEHSEHLNQVPTSQIYKLDEGEYDRQTQAALSVVPDDVMEGSTCSSYRHRPLPEIGSLRKAKKRNPVRVHVSTTTQESVRPFQYKKQPNMEFCLERSASGNHLAGPSQNHHCKHFMLYQFANDLGLRSPVPSLATDYCDLVCSYNMKLEGADGASIMRPNKHEEIKAMLNHSNQAKTRTTAKELVIDSRFASNLNSSTAAPTTTKSVKLKKVIFSPSQLEIPCDKRDYYTEIVTREVKDVYKLSPSEIPDLAHLPAVGVNVENGMKPFFGKFQQSQPISGASPSSISDHGARSSSGLLSDFQLSPTRSLSEGLSRPPSEKTLQSAREPTIPGADLSVLYDQESLDRNVNNNNANTKDAKMRGGKEATPIQSRLSFELPAAPAGTPYTPKTPYKEGKTLEKLEGIQPSPEGVTLEVIQEQSTVDEFATDARKIAKDPNLTTRSVIESRPPASPDKRRVVSAVLPRMEAGQMVSGKRAQSANVSMGVPNTPSLTSRAEQMLDAQQSGQLTRVTTSRLDVVSTTSNWPNVDEEALLREQTTPKPESPRIVSAPDRKPAKDKHRRPSTQPSSAKELEPLTTSIVVNLQPLQMRKNSPAPPPPSPEPVDKEINSKLIGEDSSNSNENTAMMRNYSDLTTAAIVDMSELNDLPSTADDPSASNQPPKSPLHPTDQSEIDKQILNQSNLNLQSYSPTMPGSQPPSRHEQQMGDLNRNLELSMNVVNGADALSLIPDTLYREMDMEREITLSALPPSVLDTPELSSVNLRADEVAPVSKVKEEPPTTASVALPTLSEVMSFDDQGGLSGH